jgi:cysteine synthase A
MEILGARLTIIPSDSGAMTQMLTRNMIEAANAIARKIGAFWIDQLNNKDQIVAYHRLGEEILRQTNDRIDAFVQSVGSAASIRGVAEALRHRTPQTRIVAVEPAESAVLSGEHPGAHKIDGVGAGFVVPLWTNEIPDEIDRVSTDDARAMALRLAREEGIFAGPSTGANVVAALRLAKKLGPDATIVTMMCDTGMKYLQSFGTALRSEAPVRTTPQ